jgi:hypothetical protein
MSPRRKTVPISDAEILMILRAYTQVPAQWPEILHMLKENIHQLPVNAQTYYRDTDKKILLNRMRSKVGKMLRKNIRYINNHAIR